MKPISKDLATTELKRGTKIVAMPRCLGKGHPVQLHSSRHLAFYATRWDYILMEVN